MVVLLLSDDSWNKKNTERVDDWNHETKSNLAVRPDTACRPEHNTLTLQPTVPSSHNGYAKNTKEKQTKKQKKHNTAFLAATQANPLCGLSLSPWEQTQRQVERLATFSTLSEWNGC